MESEAALLGLCLISGKACPKEQASNEGVGADIYFGCRQSEIGASLVYHHDYHPVRVRVGEGGVGPKSHSLSNVTKCP